MGRQSPRLGGLLARWGEEQPSTTYCWPGPLIRAVKKGARCLCNGLPLGNTKVRCLAVTTMPERDCPAAVFRAGKTLHILHPGNMPFAFSRPLGVLVLVSHSLLLGSRTLNAWREKAYKWALSTTVVFGVCPFTDRNYSFRKCKPHASPATAQEPRGSEVLPGHASVLAGLDPSVWCYIAYLGLPSQVRAKGAQPGRGATVMAVDGFRGHLETSPPSGAQGPQGGHASQGRVKADPAWFPPPPGEGALTRPDTVENEVLS